MKFATALDELSYWMQRLEFELRSGTAPRHIVALERLCGVFADKVSRDKRAPPSELPRRMALSTAWLDLQRKARAAIGSAQQTGHLRLIRGGKPS